MCIASAACFGAMAIFGKLAYDEGATVGTLLAVRRVGEVSGVLRGLDRLLFGSP